MGISWEYCQKNSNKILSDATWQLYQSPEIKAASVPQLYSGVYLISHSDVHYYIGQADNVKKRIKQQYSSRSTFYKNYLQENDSQKKLLEIEEFRLRTLSSKIGRKELEEFGIVNLKTNLNKFHKNKRDQYPIKSEQGLWNEIQLKAEEILEEGETLLFSSKVLPWKQADLFAVPGIYYVLDKNEQLIYLGESTDVSRRHHMHSNRTYISALRRHVGTDIFGFGFVGKKKFTSKDDQEITRYLYSCYFSWMEVSFGRLELEEFLIQKHQPKLNRKSKK